jgi:hypothetical protein
LLNAKTTPKYDISCKNSSRRRTLFFSYTPLLSLYYKYLKRDNLKSENTDGTINEVIQELAGSETAL